MATHILDFGVKDHIYSVFRCLGFLRYRDRKVSQLSRSRSARASMSRVGVPKNQQPRFEASILRIIIHGVPFWWSPVHGSPHNVSLLGMHWRASAQLAEQQAVTDLLG